MVVGNFRHRIIMPLRLLGTDRAKVLSGTPLVSIQIAMKGVNRHHLMMRCKLIN